MIAMTFRYRNSTEPTDSTCYDTSSQTNYWISGTQYSATYTITSESTIKLSLKELRKIWAYERMVKWWFNPTKKEPNKRIKIKPIPLRCVMLDGMGWANQN